MTAKNPKFQNALVTLATTLDDLEREVVRIDGLASQAASQDSHINARRQTIVDLDRQIKQLESQHGAALAVLEDAKVQGQRIVAQAQQEAARIIRGATAQASNLEREAENLIAKAQAAFSGAAEFAAAQQRKN